MKRFILSAGLVALLALGISCGAQNANVFGRVTNGISEPAAAPTAAPAATSAPAQPMISEAYDSSGNSAGQRKAQSVPGAAQPPTQPNSDQIQDGVRMIVYTGSLSMQVNDTADTINKIQDILKSVNGYIATKTVVASGKDKLRGTINIRVPAAALDTTLSQIKALGVKVLKETADSNDVTSEYVDLDARRKNLEAYEVELTKLLETVRERTGKAEDILAVYNQLTEVRGQIEQIKGRQNYLENTSTLATYTIELVPVEEVVVEGDPGWNPGRTARQALDQLVETLQGLGDVVITLTLLVLPVLIILLLPVVVFVWIVRALWKRRVPKKQVPAS